MDKYIYIAKAVGHEDIYKVGESADPVSRVKALKSDYKCDFELLFKEIQVNYGVEREALARLSCYRTNLFGSGRREIFKADYRTILNYVIYANTPDRDDDDLDYITSVLPRLIEERGEDYCIHNNKYKVRPMGDDSVLVSVLGGDVIDWSKSKTGWSSGEEGVTIDWYDENHVEIEEFYGEKIVMPVDKFKALLLAITSIKNIVS